MIKLLKSQAGMTFIELMMVTTITAVVAVGMGTALKQQQRLARTQQFLETLELLRDSYERQIRDNVAWGESVMANATLACLQDEAVDCARNEDPNLFNMMDSDGNPFLGFDQGDPSAGFNLSGENCDTYSAANPSGNCAIRPTITWEADLDAANQCTPNCSKPDGIVRVSFEVARRDGEGPPIDVSRFSVNRPRKGERMYVKPASCDGNTLMVGVEADGTPECLSRDAVIPNSCARPWGGARINHNAFVTAWAESIARGRACRSQRRTCNDGSLPGSYRFPSCRVQCAGPWGGWYNQGARLRAYNASISTNCRSQTRTCLSNGRFNGSYRFRNCQNCRPPNVIRGGRCVAGTRTFRLGRGSCGRGYCGTNIPGRCASKSRRRADSWCRQQGYRRSTGTMSFSSRGREGVRYCAPSGRSCFINKNASCNRYWTRLTCTN